MDYRPFDEDKDIFLLYNWTAKDKEWLDEELIPEESSAEDFERLIEKYRSEKGEWLVWQQEGMDVGITFFLPSAESNGQPWIGTVIVNPEYRRAGYGKEIIRHITHLVKQNKVIFAANPFAFDDWHRFLGTAGFEQYKIEKDESGREYLLFVLPIDT
ncbi:GNAT family N-acetyltransferase [Pseudalkalibacillus caeni]|uniref:GNAT family N-acetyltransferase n=1 Tax=Exobacillus caeni TaxID=2574798 RepID=UPI0014850E99|nr:GNAT family N-acetyltransferase [Pseudalkalibacillus caeni]